MKKKRMKMKPLFLCLFLFSNIMAVEAPLFKNLAVIGKLDGVPTLEASRGQILKGDEFNKRYPGAFLTLMNAEEHDLDSPCVNSNSLHDEIHFTDLIRIQGPYSNDNIANNSGDSDNSHYNQIVSLSVPNSADVYVGPGWFKASEVCFQEKSAIYKNNELSEALKNLVNTHLRALVDEEKMHSLDYNMANLQNIDLHKANLEDVDLTGVNFYHANLTNANLSHAILIDANLSSSDLTYATLKGCFGNKANFQGSKLNGVKASLGLFQGANFNNAIITHADFNDAILQDAKLTNADLFASDFTYAVLEKAAITRTFLIKTVLERANLRGADFQKSYLTGANLLNADLTGADLTEATLTHAKYQPEQLVNAVGVSRDKVDGQKKAENSKNRFWSIFQFPIFRLLGL